MARIYNKNVQDNALKFLQLHYQKRFENHSVLVQKNVKTRRGKLVGGLVACTAPGTNSFTAAIEARSIGSIHKFFPFLYELSWLWKILLVSFFLAGLITVIGFFIPQYFFHFLVPSVSLLVMYFIAGLIKGEHQHIKEGELAFSISRIPANEKWLVLSVDANLMDLHSQLDILRHKCERKGIGILSVSHGKKVSIVQLPQAQHALPADYLDHYRLEIPAKPQAAVTTYKPFTPKQTLSPGGLATAQAFIKAS